MPARIRSAPASAPAPAPLPAPPTPRALQLDVESLLLWARSIARGVREDYRFGAGSQDEFDLEGVSYLAVVELAHRFDEARLPSGGDLEGAFKGWAAVEVRSRCRREAVRLRTGGTVRTSGDARVRRMRVESLSNRACGCELGELLAAREPAEDADEPEEVACRHEPVLEVLENGTPKAVKVKVKVVE